MSRSVSYVCLLACAATRFEPGWHVVMLVVGCQAAHIVPPQRFTFDAEPGINVSHVPQLGLWVVRAGYSIKFSVANTTEHGTDRRSAVELLEDALNLRTPTVYDYDARSEKDVVNVPATEAARDKQEKIKERFKNWIWQDDERRERLARKYNDEFNNVRLRTFNGDHLTLPGASPAIELRPHQRAAVWRILQTPNCLLAHVVGAGKTYTMVAAAMELKRLGFPKSHVRAGLGILRTALTFQTGLRALRQIHFMSELRASRYCSCLRSTLTLLAPTRFLPLGIARGAVRLAFSWKGKAE